MRIGELSKQTGVAASRIRYYERHAVLPRAGRSENGYRQYPDSALKILYLIDAAQRLGFSLGEIRKGLSDAAPDFPSHAAMAKALRSKLDALDEHLEDIRARRLQVVRLLEELSR